ncbi:nucleotide exchange factor GrpE [Natrialbaceae archaeon AArc-T1-2]|uniref:nucleotide exchange factor GrpE n=1 Tax=Natrialbaceae archaeon AArc-T1-2 TaxID=3053904 RepID=UPI00255AF4EC|nr:nucleotide exchange factor GrpE [Natrialbaceae archaeon AArc-T1-2]WIV66905.1 nucleotide exchange factor GrpE [Natrialbaceae archaeon AArc-T1-2]
MSEDERTDSAVSGVSSEAEPDDETDVDEPSASDSSSDGEPTADAPDDADHESAVEAGGVLDRITEYDDELAADVSAIVETARDLEEAVETQRAELADLRERIDDQAETIEEKDERIDDLESALKRTKADFQNYKKRAKKRQQQLEERATEDLVTRLVDVRDDLKRALEEESGDAEALRDGVEMTMREFDRVLEEENVEEIDPDPGTEVDPQRHEVMVRVDSALPEGTIDEVYTSGYEMAGKVIQDAQVTVSNGALAEEDDSSDDESAAESDDAET